MLKAVSERLIDSFLDSLTGNALAHNQAEKLDIKKAESTK